MDAAKWYISSHETDFENIEDFIEKTNKGKLEVGVARNMILCYQRNLTHLNEAAA